MGGCAFTLDFFSIFALFSLEGKDWTAKKYP